jgi:hypothetical protein
MRSFVEIKNFDATRKLVSSQPVTIKLLETPRSDVYKTSIHQVLGPETFTVKIPPAHRIEEGIPAEMRVEHASGVFLVPIKLVRKTEEAIDEWLLRVAGPVQKVQERQFFRVQVDHKTEYQKVVRLQTEDGQVEIVDADNQVFPGRIQDLSASGLMLLSDQEELKVGDTVAVDFHFINPRFDQLLASVVRVIEPPVDKAGAKWAAGLQFINLEDRKTHAILEWLFERQRDRNR